MKRKIFSKLLMGAFLIASVSMFVSCKDYDDDIERNSQEIEALKAKLNSDISDAKSDFASQLSTVTTQITTLKSDIDAKIAKLATAADVKAATDALQKDIDELKGLTQRVAVLETQIAAIDALKSDVAAKANQSDYEALAKQVGDLAALTGNFALAKDIPDEAQIKVYAEAVVKSLAVQQDAFDAYKKQVEGDLAKLATKEEIKNFITKAEAADYVTTAKLQESLKGLDIDALNSSINKLNELIDDSYKAKLDDLLKNAQTKADVDGAVSAAIKEYSDGVTKKFEELNKEIDTKIGTQMSALEAFITKQLKSIVLKPNFYWEGIEGIEAPFIYQTPVFEEKGNYTFKYNLTNAPAGTPAVDVWVEKSMGWKGFGDKRELAKYVIAGPRAAHFTYPDVIPGAAGPAKDRLGYYLYNMGAVNTKAVSKIDIAYGAEAKYHLNPSTADIDGATLAFYENDAPVYTRAAGLSIEPKVVTDGVTRDANDKGILNVPFTVNYMNVVRYFVDWTNSQTANWEGNVRATKEDWSNLWYPVTGGAQYGRDDSDTYIDRVDDSGEQFAFSGNLPFVALKVDVPANTEKDIEAYNVNSDYAVVVPALYEIVALADKDPEEDLDQNTFLNTGAHEIRNNHLYETVGYDDSGITAEDALLANQKWNNVKAYGAIPMPATHSVPYNGSIDLSKYVETHFNYRTFAQYGKSQYDAVLDTWDGGALMKKLGLEYRYTIINYTTGAETTSESAHIEQDATTPSIFYPRSVTEDGKTIKGQVATREVVDREPLIRVDLVNTKGNNEIIRYGYIKLRITETAAVNKDIEVAINMPEIWMNCGDEAKITWSQVENLILAQLGGIDVTTGKPVGMTKGEFERIYKLDVEGNYAFMPFLDPTKVAGDTDPAGPLYTPSWTAKRYVKNNGNYVLAKDETAPVSKWTATDNHFGEVWYTPHDNSTEGHNWDEQTNVLIWNFYPGTFAGARATLAAPVAKTAAGNMDNAKYQKLMEVSGVDYDTQGTSKNEVSTVVRFINKQNNTSIWVTLKVPAEKLHFQYGYVGNKNWSHWFEFNSAKGGSESNTKPYWTEFDTRINPFKPSNVNYRFLNVDDFNQMLTDHWMNPGAMITYQGNNTKFSNFATGTAVTFEFTTPQAGKNSKNLSANAAGEWKIKGVSGTEWTLKVGAHGATYAPGTDALWVVKKGTAVYEEEVAYLDQNIAGVANNVKIHYHGLEAAAPNLYPAATDLVNLMGAYDEQGNERFSTTSNELTNLSKAYFLEDNENRAFTAYIKISVTHWCYDPIISKQFFNVRFHRPINVVAKEYNWNDRNLNDNYINIKDLIEVVDWNRFPVVPYNNSAVKANKTMFGMDFPSYAEVYASNKVKQQNLGIPFEFYGISELAIRYGEIRSDMPKPMSVRNNLAGTLANLSANSVKISEIPALVSPREAPAGYKTITLLNANGTIAGWGANDYNQSNYNAAAPGNTSYGRIYFNNDGSDTQLFHIFLPIAVKYNWGNIAYDKNLDPAGAKLDKDYTQVVWAVITVNGTH